MTFVSYAQNFEDVMLWRALRHVANGFYIDVGAAHPDTDSVTRAFYDRGWSGINIEPTPEYSLRLAAARPRDTNLQMVLGERTGQTQLFVVDGTGLSTVEQSALGPIRNAGMDVHAADVAVDTLARVCAKHAAETIHFLKIDVEGAERSVLAGADFSLFRPWIVVVEATAPMSTTETHAEWEFILLESDYRFVWFDGLNRFYVSAEMHDALRGAFTAPPNVFDDFLRAADSEWARRINEAESRASVLRERLVPAELRLTQLLERAVAAEGRASYEALAAAHARIRGDDLTRELEQLRSALAREHAKREAAELSAEAEAQRALYEIDRSVINERREFEAVTAFEAMRTSTSWRITAPLRRLRSRISADGPAITQAPALPRREEPRESLAKPPGGVDVAPTARAPYRTAVHQFHSGSATGDAITNSMLLTRKRLRDLGYRSDIFVTFRDEALAHELRLTEELPRHEHYVLILLHSMGFDSFKEVASVVAPKILLYHNITPPDLLEGDAFLQSYAAIGREQLKELRHVVSASLAISEYNAVELRTLGFSPVQVCETLIDMDSLRARVAAVSAARDADIFTILFVGRVVRSKGQAELVDIFASFRHRYGKPCRLVLVGRHGGTEDAYVQSIEQRVAAYQLSEDVVLTGVVSDEDLHNWYASADVYLSMSRHEGFGVPLVEAMAHGLPVLARPAGAVPFTLRDTGGLLVDDTPDAVVDRLLEMARSTGDRAALVKRQHAALACFRWSDSQAVLLEALSAAGAVPPIKKATREALAAAMHITVTGHVNGSYSLAAVNRRLALAMDSVRPGTLRLLPVEGEATTALDGVPEAETTAVAALVARPKPVTGPHIVISQHYPVHVPQDKGDLALAYFFWEESVVPPETIALLNRSFGGVLAPSRFVAKSLVDSGLSIPVRVVGFTPDLEKFRALSAARQTTGPRPFTFLHISSGFPRKGVDILIEAFRRAFRQTDNVRLIIKVFPNPHNEVGALLASLQDEDADAPEIVLIDRDIDEQALLDLYRDADAMAVPTRGEGFNLPAAEAMAAGLPLIVTGFGGHMDFCTDAVRGIDFSFAPSGSHLAVAGSLWAEPDVDDLTRALSRAVWERPEAVTPPRLRSVRSFTDTLVAAAADVLLAPPLQRSLRIGWVSSWGVRCGVAEYSRHLIEAMLADAEPGEIMIFSDTRTAQPQAGSAQPHVLPCWTLGLGDTPRPLIRAIAGYDPDVLVIQHQPGLIAWAALAEMLSSATLAACQVVLVLHTTRRLLDMADAERRLLIEALRLAARIVVHTVEDLNRLREFGLVANTVMIPQGAVERPQAAAGQASVRPTVIGCYGFFLPEKGISQLIEAVARLGAERDIRLRLVNADYGTPDSAGEIARCRALAGAAGLDQRIDWQTEFQSDEDSLRMLGECDLIVLPYQQSKEGSSAALRMALSSGVPVAVTPLPLFDEAENAIYRFAGTEPADLASGIAHLLDRPEALQALREAAQLWLAPRRWPLIATRFGGMLRGLHVNANRP